MGVDAFPEDVDWAPPPDVLRLIARQTACVTTTSDADVMPSPSASRDTLHEEKSLFESEQQNSSSSLAGTGNRGRKSIRPQDQAPTTQIRMDYQDAGFGQSAGWASPNPSIARSPNPSIQKLTQSSSHIQLLTTSASQGSDFSFVTSQCTTLDFNATQLEGRSRSEVQRKNWHERYSSHKKEHEDPMRTMKHEIAWDSSLRVPQNLYDAATPQVCSCRKPFEDGAAFCRRCGTRRPEEAPPPVPDIPKAIHVVNQHHLQEQDVLGRQYAWSGIYSERMYRLQMQRFEDEEEWKERNYFTPRINPNSTRIAKSKDMPPLMERVSDIITARERKLEQQRQEAEQANLQELQDGPCIHPKSAGVQRNLKSLYRWELKKNLTHRNKLDRQLEVEAASCPFKPSISTASSRIAQDYVDVQVHKRLADDAKKRHLEYTEEYQSTLKSSLFNDAGTPGGSRSKPGTPSTTTPSSARSGSSTKTGISMSPRARGCKTDEWRGKVAFPKSGLFNAAGENVSSPGRAHCPRASMAVLDDSQRKKMIKGLKNKGMSQTIGGRSISLSPTRGTLEVGRTSQALRSNSRHVTSNSANQRSQSADGRSDKSDKSKKLAQSNFSNGIHFIKYDADFHEALEIAQNSYD